MEFKRIMWRVTLKDGYHEIEFDFPSSDTAVEFANNIYWHKVPKEDEEPIVTIRIMHI